MAASEPAYLYLSPGMFGFGRVAGYDYFGHVATALGRRFRARGREAVVRVVEVHPTASVRRRAALLAETIAASAGPAGPIHIVGHSTGGLDARLLASPSAHLHPHGALDTSFLARLSSITTINTPHYGTPLASFFATAKGQQLLYALSAITVTALGLGAPPLAAASALVAALGRTGNLLGVELRLVDGVVEPLARALDDAAARELRDWLRRVRDDQGGVVQLMPEAMDVFNAAVEDRPGVRYQCVASWVPPGGVVRWLGAVLSPWKAVSGALFQIVQRVTGREDARYPCHAPDAARALERVLGEVPPAGANDGIVPLRSQIWGELCWAGKGDHLDLVGHFTGPDGHTDWLASGAHFDVARFAAIMDRIAEGMLGAEDRDV
jgi:hypothetical protein